MTYSWKMFLLLLQQAEKMFCRAYNKQKKCFCRAYNKQKKCFCHTYNKQKKYFCRTYNKQNARHRYRYYVPTDFIGCINLHPIFWFKSVLWEWADKWARPGCSKLTISLVNVSLKFQTLISNTCIRQYFLLKKWEKLFSAKASLIFFNKK